MVKLPPHTMEIGFPFFSWSRENSIERGRQPADLGSGKPSLATSCSASTGNLVWKGACS